MSGSDVSIVFSGLPTPGLAAFKGGVEAACRRQGTIKLEAAEWIADILQACAQGNSGKPDLLVRAAGQQVSVDQLKALGLRANTRLGDRFLLALTDKGRRDVMESALNLTSEAFTIATNAETLSDVARVGGQVRVLLPQGAPRGSVCKGARGIRRRRFPPKEAPPLPIDGCTARCCDCLWIIAID